MDNVVVLMVPFPAQSHLNQLLQLSSLISSYDIPVHYISSTVHARQSRLRANGLSSLEIAKIHFQELSIPPFASPPPNPNSSNKFPSQLEPSYYAALGLRQPFYAYVQTLSSKFNRVVVIHDAMMAFVVQDVALVPNAESYVFNAISAFSLATYTLEKTGQIPEEFAKGLPPFEDCVTDGIKKFVALQFEQLKHRAGDIYNTCRFMESSYLDVLANEGGENRKSFAIGPILPAKLSSPHESASFKWLDEQEANSVIFVNFGTTVSLSDEEIEELALGLEQSKQRFFWVLRDADKGNIFEGEVRKGKLPQGFEERVKDVGVVVRDWAPQLEILAHSAIGGFMSHCGWNSCIESIATGVPIAAWPMHSDQPRNAMLVTDILKIGILVKEWSEEEELVKASRIESVVRRLMASEEGNEMRKRVEELSVIVRRATEEGGVSRLELYSFIAHINREVYDNCGLN